MDETERVVRERLQELETEVKTLRDENQALKTENETLRATRPARERSARPTLAPDS